jgi:Double zinc ribbon
MPLPRPYSPTEHDTVPCPNEACGLMNRAGAHFCRHCGYTTGEPAAHAAEPGDDITCNTCGQMLPDDSRVCSDCGHVLSASAVSAQIGAGQVPGLSTPKEPTSSAGRQPMDTDPAARREFFDGLDDGGGQPPAGRTLLERISAAEALVEVCEEADAEGQVAMRVAAHEAPRFPDRRVLSPSERTAYVAVLGAAARCSETQAALTQARRDLAHLLAKYDDIAADCRLVMDGRLAGRTLRLPGEY